MTKAGFKVLGSCGLQEWKEKNYPLLYPKDDAGKKEESKKKE